MLKRRIYQGILAFLVCLTLACETLSIPLQKTPTLQNTPTLYSTSTYQSTPAFPLNAPTPISTVQKPLLKPTFGDTKLSDANGTVVLEDSLAHMKLNIHIQDNSTNKPLQNIEVQYISDGKEFLLVAIDPSGKYLSFIKSGPSSLISSVLNSINNNTGYLLLGDLIQLQGGSEEVDLILKLTDILDNATSLKDLASLLSGIPSSIEQWAIGSVDVCLDGEQLANYFSADTGAAEVILPISALLTGPYDFILVAAYAISSHILTEDAQAYLNGLPGSYNIRISYYPITFSFRSIEYLGQCATPTPTFTPTLLPTNDVGVPQNQWPDSLIGQWTGIVKFDMFSVHSQSQRNYTIQRESDGSMIAVSGGSPSIIEQGRYTYTDPGDGNLYYCFSNYYDLQDIEVRNLKVVAMACFSPITDHQLKYVGGSVTPSENGILTRVK
jgi:hypothetical protein